VTFFEKAEQFAARQDALQDAAVENRTQEMYGKAFNEREEGGQGNEVIRNQVKSRVPGDDC
jgi:hypothetical protein